MSELSRYGSSGAHTVEGNVSGRRAAQLTKAREQQQQAFALRKSELQRAGERGARIDQAFESHRDDDEAEFKRQTVGLVSAEEFRQKREDIEKRKDRRDDAEREDRSQEPEKPKATKTTKKKRSGGSKAKKVGLLSFDLDEGGEDEPVVAKKRKKSIKNPDVETDFLPDRARELEEARERRRLRAEWEEEQERVKNENVSVTYSYWDGSGHRREITIPKKTTIGKYLELVKQQLVSEFPELRGVSSDNLLYIKEDLIIPHNYSFYDLIVTKARGKSGPLFHFDVHDDVRLINDARVEKDESHPGKVVERHWYEKNKHIFPASRWEVYDPSVKRDKYTIHGDEVNKKQ